jgi:hypothetical protein
MKFFNILIICLIGCIILNAPAVNISWLQFPDLSAGIVNMTEAALHKIGLEGAALIMFFFGGLFLVK